MQINYNFLVISDNNANKNQKKGINENVWMNVPVVCLLSNEIYLILAYGLFIFQRG